MKRSIAVLLLFSLVIAFSGCFYSNHDYEQDYDKDWIIGKTAAEITERYGTFDSYGHSYSYYTGEILGWQGIYYLSDDIRAFDGEKLYGKDLEIYFNIDDGVATTMHVDYITRVT